VFVAYIYVWRKGGLEWSGVTVVPVDATTDLETQREVVGAR
jgi:hypothetical protein